MKNNILLTIRQTNVFLMLCFLVLYVAACSDQDGKTQVAGATTINRVGEYIVGQHDTRIKVWYSNDTVNYTAKTQSGQLLIRSIAKASKFSRWFLYWDQNDRLWFYSGDIGTVVWVSDAHGPYKSLAITENNRKMLLQLPQDVFEEFPNSIRKRLQSSSKGN